MAHVIMVAGDDNKARRFQANKLNSCIHALKLLKWETEIVNLSIMWFYIMYDMIYKVFTLFKSQNIAMRWV